MVMRISAAGVTFRKKVLAVSASLNFDKSARNGYFIDHFAQMQANSDKVMVASGYFSKDDCTEICEIW